MVYVIHKYTCTQFTKSQFFYLYIFLLSLCTVDEAEECGEFFVGMLLAPVSTQTKTNLKNMILFFKSII